PLFSTENQFAPESAAGDGEHTYRVRVDAGQMVEVIIRSETVDTYVEAVLPDGARVINDDYEGLNAGFMRLISSGGVMTIEASPLFDEGQGAYQVIVQQVGDAERIAPGDSIAGRFDKTDVFEGVAVDRYWFSGSAGQIVVIDLTSNDFDAYLRIQDEQGREFIDDDGGSGRNSRVSYAFDRDGMLSIQASSFSGDQVGRYELRVADIGTQEPVATYQGELSLTSDRAYDGKRIARHEYAGTAGETVSVHLQSSSFDTQLYMSGPSGESIAVDDDGGGGTNSLITVTLPETGPYAIYAVPFLDGTGPYRISVYR
ncbi:MAG: PPC domain-containing protein, partial [Alkalispirochaeta sp.]